jgi:hypothetical protein
MVANVPAGSSTVTDGANGPAAVVASVPVGEDDVTVATTGCIGRAATPATCTCTGIGCETAPAATALGADGKPSVVGDQARKARQLPINAAPSRSPPHQVYRPSGLQAREPGSAGLSVAESRIAAASRSSTSPLCSVKSAGTNEEAFRGAQAKPQWSSVRPERTPWLRSA